MKHAIHFLDVDEPLIAYHRLTVRCGVELQNAAFMFGYVEELKAEMNLPFNLCPACLRRPPIGGARRQYLYGLTERSEQVTRQSEEAA